jgi:hypothetical protein
MKTTQEKIGGGKTIMGECTEGRHIFISYRRIKPDMEFAYQLADDLRAAGHPVWIDVKGIEGGGTWNQDIQQGIDECYAYIVVVSPDSLASDWVRNEMLYALEYRRGCVYPVLFRPVDRLPVELMRIQYTDFQGDYDAALAKLLRALSPTPSPRRAPHAPATSRRGLALPSIMVVLAGVLCVAAVVVGYLAFNRIMADGSPVAAGEPGTIPLMGVDEEASATPQPAAEAGEAGNDKPTPAPPPIIENFRFCEADCLSPGSVPQDEFPVGTTEIWVAWEYSGMQPGMRYSREWYNRGERWIHYDCVWEGLESGTWSLRLYDENSGLRSGEWTIRVAVEGEVETTASVEVAPGNENWDPAGTLDCPDW